ncbi:photosynthesis system II assembly factor Ycf48 [Argonema antarcticum]|uniref:photosynthesis system II assembly factor Ycf48 n=1 Tax=Argonema antarcticum TaxID=2942763 RepID=UPI002011FC86|nr:photosynthesis system II assembly factor Ycf48 [Argonema antarcticum]MCL1470493.1 photosynthesis system II assembly factor Ycf48 [Argonema antarcticum A004/B2]
MRSLLKSWQRVGVLLAVALLCLACSKVPSISQNPWQVVSLPTNANLMDIAFTGNPMHGWLVGSQSTLLETTDGGETWQSRELDLGGQKYRFNSVSFNGQEGWIVGEPSLLLYTNDEGKTWSRIPLSEKLPGNPNTVLALAPQSAEMTTDVGAIYRTTDGGQTWKALVQQAVGVVRNISRSIDGKYVAVSANGSFYSTWQPGQDAWEPHNRNSSRRVQNMGFIKDGGLWMLARGGQVQFTDPEKPDEWLDADYPEFSASWGLLDLAFRTPDEIWVAGGGGNLLCSFDGGKTWQKDREVEDVPSNFYKILFLTPEKGFIIGQRGTLLKYQGTVEAA